MNRTTPAQKTIHVLKPLIWLGVLSLLVLFPTLFTSHLAWAQPPIRIPKPFPIPVPLPGTVKDKGRIAFASWRDGKGEIYVINADGSGLTRLTRNTTDDWQPSFSPDGRKIAFVSNRDGNDEIYIMNADATGQTRLTNNTKADQHPAFSPDGQSIVFTSWRGERVPANMFIMNVDGSQQRRLVIGTDSSLSGMEAAFHPNGSRVAFSNGSIRVVNTDGSGASKPTQPGYGPTFSPDGSKVAFTGQDAQAMWQVFIMNGDGTEQRCLTNNFEFAGEPCFSPDGKKIAFVSTYNGDKQICVMDLDGSHVRGLIKADSHNLQPSWGPSAPP